MRREILYSLPGFLVGFVFAGIVFWQPVRPSGETPSVSESAPKREADLVSTGDRTRTRIVVSGSESDTAAPIADDATQPKGAAETFQEAIGKLKDLDTASMARIVKTLSQQLRAAGPEGIQALRDYFRAGQDVTFQHGYVVVDGKMVHSLRTALLDSLGDWPADVANEFALGTLRSTSRRADASIAIRLLEKNAPGVYRAEAIQAFQQLAAKPFEKGDWLTNDMLFDTMRRYKAVELLPVAEATLGNNAFETAKFITSLDALPADVRAGALQRLFANEAVTKYLPTSPQALQSLNYSEPLIAQGVAQIFAANTDRKFREDFLKSIGEPWSYGMTFGTTDTHVANWQARAAFLDTIAPQCSTPVLQERLQDARAALQKAIANPDDNGLTKGGSGTLILSSGTNGLSNGTINISSQFIEITTTEQKK